MGTDIHGKFQKLQGDGAWADVDTEFTFDRCYQLFAALAGVRNGCGFAGIATGDVIEPIAPPRGIPEDLAQGNEYLGDHSFSWLSGAEMLAWYAHAPEVSKLGCISRAEYDAWDGVNPPEVFCGMISGPKIRVVLDTPEDMERIPDWTHVRISWRRDLKGELQYFFNEVQRLVDEHGEIRFVFGFDS
jgi:hypothetical protein